MTPFRYLVSSPKFGPCKGGRFMCSHTFSLTEFPGWAKLTHSNPLPHWIPLMVSGEEKVLKRASPPGTPHAVLPSPFTSSELCTYSKVYLSLQLLMCSWLSVLFFSRRKCHFKHSGIQISGHTCMNFC